jgi:hypothetical protein
MYICWIFYLAIMNLQRARNANLLTPIAYKFGLPILYTGLLIDFLVNIFGLTIMFLDLPKEWLVTSRLTRYWNGSIGWRHSLAHWYAINLLDNFDPSGKHIK